MTDRPPKPQKIRWHAVASWFFLLLGSAILAASVAAGFQQIRMAVLLGGSFSQPSVLRLIMSSEGGIIWVLSGVAFFRGKRRAAAFGAIVGYLCGILTQIM
jgi:hypothetical protein